MKHAVVTKFSTGEGLQQEDFLAAYYTTTNNVESETIGNELHALCVRSFPSHMVPASFVRLSSFPTNRNGKVDRNQLPKPTLFQPQSEAAATKKRGPGEIVDLRLAWLRQQLLSLWLELFPSPANETLLAVMPNFSENVFCDSWLEMGASSLTLMRFISKIKFLYRLVLVIHYSKRHLQHKQTSSRRFLADPDAIVEA